MNFERYNTGYQSMLRLILMLLLSLTTIFSSGCKCNINPLGTVPTNNQNDNTAPEVIILNAPDSVLPAGTTQYLIEVEGVDSSTPSDMIQYRCTLHRDEKLVQQWSEYGTSNILLSGLSAGHWVFHVVAIDMQDNESSPGAVCVFQIASTPDV